MTTFLVILMAMAIGFAAGGLLLLTRWRGEVALRRERAARRRAALEELTRRERLRATPAARVGVHGPRPALWF
jgi:hypothetical protein